MHTHSIYLYMYHQVKFTHANVRDISSTMDATITTSARTRAMVTINKWVKGFCWLLVIWFFRNPQSCCLKSLVLLVMMSFFQPQTPDFQLKPWPFTLATHGNGVARRYQFATPLLLNMLDVAPELRLGLPWCLASRNFGDHGKPWSFREFNLMGGKLFGKWIFGTTFFFVHCWATQMTAGSCHRCPWISAPWEAWSCHLRAHSWPRGMGGADAERGLVWAVGSQG